MRLTKLEHACVRLEKNGTSIIVDPGNWTGPEALDGAGAVLGTHEHFDHLNAAVIRAAVTADPATNAHFHHLTANVTRAALTATQDRPLCSTEPVTAQFGEFGDRVRTV